MYIYENENELQKFKNNKENTDFWPMTVDINPMMTFQEMTRAKKLESITHFNIWKFMKYKNWTSLIVSKQKLINYPKKYQDWFIEPPNANCYRILLSDVDFLFENACKPFLKPLSEMLKMLHSHRLLYFENNIEMKKPAFISETYQKLTIEHSFKKEKSKYTFESTTRIHENKHNLLSNKIISILTQMQQNRKVFDFLIEQLENLKWMETDEEINAEIRNEFVLSVQKTKKTGPTWIQFQDQLKRLTNDDIIQVKKNFGLHNKF